jgi:hypothetical protein
MTDTEYLRQRVDKLAEDQAAEHECVKGIADDCAKIKQCLLGNGQPGLVVRTDRLEQKEKTRSRLMWLIVSGVVALILNAVAGHINVLAQ